MAGVLVRAASTGTAGPDSPVHTSFGKMKCPAMRADTTTENWPDALTLPVPISVPPEVHGVVPQSKI